MYTAGQKQQQTRRRRRWPWIVLLFFIALGIIGYIVIPPLLKPEKTVKQAKAVTTKVSYEETKKHIIEQDFEFDLPLGWEKQPNQPTSYNMYTYQSKERGTNGQVINIYQGTIPANFAVNRVLILEPQVSKVSMRGQASDNCSTFTKGVQANAPGQIGVPAKWLGIDFLCDQSNQQRDIIGTSSAEAPNTITLTSPSTGAKHKFLFSYTNYNNATPDYTPFYGMLNSFVMQ